MKNPLIFLLLFPFAAFAQARLGSMKSEIYNEFIELAPHISLMPDGSEYLVLHNENYMTLHYFDVADICTTSIIYPKTVEAENALVERYDSNYVLTEPGKWRRYTSNERYDVVKRITVNQVTFFKWD
jgi:hypothetical protein